MMGGTAGSAVVSGVAIDWVTGRSAHERVCCCESALAWRGSMFSQAHASPTWRTGVPAHSEGGVGLGQPEYHPLKSGRVFPQGPPGRCKVARKGGPRVHHLGQRIASERHTR